MRKTILILMLVTVICTIAVVSCGTQSNRPAGLTIGKDSLVKRGAYLVNAIGCDDCHSPKRFGPQGPEIIPELRLSGYPSNRQMSKVDSNTIKNGWVLLGPDLTNSVGPWGASFAGNLTSDETGIGNWKEENFIKAIREGKLKGMDGGRPILPPMPWQVYRNLDDNDLKAIFAFLKTTNPVRNIVPSPKPLKDL